MKQYSVYLITTVLGLLLNCFTANAQETKTSYDYGYKGATSETATPDTLVGLRVKAYESQHFAFLEMPANVSNTLEGCQITKIAFRLFDPADAPLGATTAKVIVTKEMNGTPLYEQETPVVGNDWNEVALDSPVTIAADEKIYIGYSVKCSGTDYPIGYFYTSEIMQQATVDPIIDYVGVITKEGEFLSNMLDALMWNSRRQTANLFLNATIENPAGIPGNAVSIGTPMLSGKDRVHPNDELSLTGIYTNTGIEELKSYHLTMTYDGQTAYDGDLQTAVGPMAEGKFNVKLPTDVVGLHKVALTIDAPNGEKNSFNGQKTASINYLVYNDSVPRKVLYEHFTTGQCTNCVAGEEKVVAALEKVDPEIKVIRVNHHSGFGTDKLTTADDVAMEWLYGGTYVWAPANMIDRTDLAAYGAYGYGGTATIGPVFGTDKSKPIEELVTSAAHLPAFISLNLNSTVDENRLLSITVDADELYEMPQQDLMRLNVVLVEDSVRAPQYLSNGEVDKTYIHYDVYRAALTGTWGEKAEFIDGHLNKTFTYEIPTKYNLNYLRIVAFLADYDETNTKNCRVYNTIEAKIGEDTLVGINSVELNPEGTDSSQPLSGCYDLQGRRVENPTHGLYIIGGKKVLR